ncbi:hypothetical protein ONS96_004627 [Cadophora gregata f. sp. sojae]|nr:hypothetical protein ONS96_004627 [Cadophora gregata f. sp. sojae]
MKIGIQSVFQMQATLVQQADSTPQWLPRALVARHALDVRLQKGKGTAVRIAVCHTTYAHEQHYSHIRLFEANQWSIRRAASNLLFEALESVLLRDSLALIERPCSLYLWTLCTFHWTLTGQENAPVTLTVLFKPATTSWYGSVSALSLLLLAERETATTNLIFTIAQASTPYLVTQGYVMHVDYSPYSIAT